VHNRITRIQNHWQLVNFTKLPIKRSGIVKSIQHVHRRQSELWKCLSAIFKHFMMLNRWKASSKIQHRLCQLIYINSVFYKALLLVAREWLHKSIKRRKTMQQPSICTGEIYLQLQCDYKRQQKHGKTKKSNEPLTCQQRLIIRTRGNVYFFLPSVKKLRLLGSSRRPSDDAGMVCARDDEAAASTPAAVLMRPIHTFISS